MLGSALFTGGRQMIGSQDSKVQGVNMGPIWGRQTQVGPMLALCYLGWYRLTPSTQYLKHIEPHCYSTLHNTILRGCSILWPRLIRSHPTDICLNVVGTDCATIDVIVPCFNLQWRQLKQNVQLKRNVLVGTLVILIRADSTHTFYFSRLIHLTGIAWGVCICKLHWRVNKKKYPQWLW